MHFDPDQPLGPIRLYDFKDYLKSARRRNSVLPDGLIRWLEHARGLDARQALDAYRALIDAGYLTEKGDHSPLTGRLCGSGFAPPISRAQAIALINAICQLALRHNATTKLYFISYVTIFGSILSAKPMLGDLDITIQLEHVLLPGETAGAALRRILGRNTSCDRGPKPQDAIRAVQRRIFYKFKKLSPSISLHGENEVDVYERDGAPRAVIFRDTRPPHSSFSQPIFEHHTERSIAALARPDPRPEYSDPPL